jgi:flavin reductase (DIM6/NTAB) family NADH-FMN oxidoreductase RutF
MVSLHNLRPLRRLPKGDFLGSPRAASTNQAGEAISLHSSACQKPVVEFVLTDITQSARYKLLTSLVVPRPIGWITSQNADGLVNLAPYSFFNVLGNTPPVVAFAPSARDDGSLKDTARNVETTAEFVVNLVTPESVDVMHRSAATYAPLQSEVLALGLELLPSLKVRTPRLAISPVHLECRYERTVEIGRNRIVFGEILVIHTPEGLVDPQTFRLASPLVAVGRLGGPGHYATTRDEFDLGPIPKV